MGLTLKTNVTTTNLLVLHFSKLFIVLGEGLAELRVFDFDVIQALILLLVQLSLLQGERRVRNIDEPLVDVQELALARFAALRQRVDLHLEVLEQLRHRLPHLVRGALLEDLNLLDELPAREVASVLASRDVRGVLVEVLLELQQAEIAPELQHGGSV